MVADEACKRLCGNCLVCLIVCSIGLFFCWVCLFFRCLTFKRGQSPFSVVGDEGCKKQLCGFFVCPFVCYLLTLFSVYF